MAPDSSAALQRPSFPVDQAIPTRGQLVRLPSRRWPIGNKAKRYQVKQVRAILLKYGLEFEHE